LRGAIAPGPSGYAYVREGPSVGPNVLGVGVHLGLVTIKTTLIDAEQKAKLGILCKLTVCVLYQVKLSQ